LQEIFKFVFDFLLYIFIYCENGAVLVNTNCKLKNSPDDEMVKMEYESSKFTCKSMCDQVSFKLYQALDSDEKEVLWNF